MSLFKEVEIDVVDFTTDDVAFWEAGGEGSGEEL